MKPHQERVVIEKSELDEKLAKLRAFIALKNSPFSDVPLAEMERLIRQCRIMEEYSKVLAERIEAFD